MKKLFSLATACILIFCLCACNAANSEDNTYKIGDTANVSGVEVTFIGISNADNGLLLCEFEIVNKTTEELTVSSILSFDAYADGTACNTGLGIHEGKESLNGTIISGQKMTGVVAFETPADWKELQIHFKPYALREDKVTFSAANSK